MNGLEVFPAHDTSRSVPRETFTCDVGILIFVMLFLNHVPQARKTKLETLERNFNAYFNLKSSVDVQRLTDIFNQNNEHTNPMLNHQIQLYYVNFKLY